MDSVLNESSRYANLPLPSETLITNTPPRVAKNLTNSNQRARFEEHVYCNQDQRVSLPPYLDPPDYDTFIRNKRSYCSESVNNQHMTYHGQTLVMERTNNSGYENLSSFCGSFVPARQESAITS